MADLYMGRGDSLPILVTTLYGPDGAPISLTGKTVASILKRQNSAEAATTPTVTPDPDQVTNPGRCSVTLFAPGVSTPGVFALRFKVTTTATGATISVRNAPPHLMVEVTADP